MKRWDKKKELYLKVHFVNYMSSDNSFILGFKMLLSGSNVKDTLRILLNTLRRDWMEMARFFTKLKIQYDCYNVRTDPVTVIIHNAEKGIIQKLKKAGWFVERTSNPAITQVENVGKTVIKATAR